MNHFSGKPSRASLESPSLGWQEGLLGVPGSSREATAGTESDRVELVDIAIDLGTRLSSMEE